MTRPVLVAFFVLLSISLGFAVQQKCFDCTSHKNDTNYHKDCVGPFDATTSKVPKKTCLPEHNACFKLVTETTMIVNGDSAPFNTIVTRMCGQQPPPKKGEEPDTSFCTRKEADAGFTTQCACDTEYCNGVDYVKASLFSIAVGTLLSLVGSWML